MNTESVRSLKLGTRYIWYPDTDVVQGSSCCVLYEARSWPVIFPRPLYVSLRGRSPELDHSHDLVVVPPSRAM